ncbi:MAG TPA: type IV pilus twitching motility protein PilT [Actinomycetota bacterium]|nr:type IV pilus twitching motility protein PilT [Actinomycetota bacterium]
MNIDDLLTIAAERLASDLHVRAGSPPYLRIDGDLIPIETAPLGAPDVERMAFDLMNEEQIRNFKQTNESDFAYSLPGVARFRVNAFRQRGAVGIAIRRVLPGSTSFEALGLPASVEALCEERRGLILVTGMTGSGKTTTTAAMINHINSRRRCHIVTIEDPIEVLHADKLAIVDQREVSIDTADFATALKHVARQDPDVIFIGEMRDPETVKAALSAAETGHLVISTLHTLDATETINRVIDFFPPHQQMQARLTLAATLKGVVSQRLLVRADGDGRVPAVEVLVATGRVFDMIVNPDQTHMIEDVIREGDFYGMQTFDQHLIELVAAGQVRFDEASAAATSPHDFSLAIQQRGIA